MRARSNRSRQMVMESGTYLAAIKTNENMAALMTNYQMLGTKDKMLVDKFVESLAAKTNKPTDITSDNEQT